MAIPAAGRRATPAAPLVAPGDVGPRPVAPMGSPGAHREGVCARSQRPRGPRPRLGVPRLPMLLTRVHGF